MEIILLLVVGFVIWAMAASAKAKRVAFQFLEEHDKAQHAHAFNGTGIAVYPDRQKLFLSGFEGNKPVAREYALDDLRSWETMDEKAGRVYGGSAVRNQAANNIEKRKAEENSGLFVRVRDVEHPEWHIRFKPSNRRKELARWSEILNQVCGQ